MSTENLKIPQHIAIIMDGNGRWAKQKRMPRNYGHMQGSKRVEDICRAAHELGVKYLTIYAFSTENWSRPADEVKALMKILRDYLKESVKKASENNMRVRVIGDRERLDEDIRASIEHLEKVSSGNTGLNFQIALNYGGRDEITRAVKSLAKKVKDGALEPEDITEDAISAELFTGVYNADAPDPELIIRTSGELRLSNFLLWQSAYSELVFPEVYWPDFTPEEFEKAIADYQNRERRFGGRK